MMRPEGDGRFDIWLAAKADGREGGGRTYMLTTLLLICKDVYEKNHC